MLCEAAACLIMIGDWGDTQLCCMSGPLTSFDLICLVFLCWCSNGVNIMHLYMLALDL